MGTLDTLSVHHGDATLSFEHDNPEQIAKAKAMIEDMLKRGYSIFVDIPGVVKDGVTTASKRRRVKRFDPKRFEYIVAETANPKDDKAIPAAGVRATAVGRPSGG